MSSKRKQTRGRSGKVGAVSRDEHRIESLAVGTAAVQQDRDEERRASFARAKRVTRAVSALASAAPHGLVTNPHDSPCTCDHVSLVMQHMRSVCELHECVTHRDSRSTTLKLRNNVNIFVDVLHMHDQQPQLCTATVAKTIQLQALATRFTHISKNAA